MSTIWIVEDDSKIALLIEMTVRKLGHDTLCLPDAEALEKERRKGTELPDLLHHHPKPCLPKLFSLSCFSLS